MDENAKNSVYAVIFVAIVIGLMCAEVAYRGLVLRDVPLLTDGIIIFAGPAKGGEAVITGLKALFGLILCIVVIVISIRFLRADV
ncbi:MAG TPA: hypothetical protein VNK96_04275 [Fimbriimonadales bacterium]|nr:hypothetical protein [Fimbriimonadales bacterium]